MVFFAHEYLKWPNIQVQIRWIITWFIHVHPKKWVLGSGLRDKYPLLVNGMLTKRRKGDVLQIKSSVCFFNEMSMYRLMTVVDVGLVWRDGRCYICYTSRAARGGAGSFKNLSIYKSKKTLPIEIVFDMLGLTDLKIQHVEPQNEKPPSFCFDTTVQHAEITTRQVVEKKQRQPTLHTTALLAWVCLEVRKDSQKLQKRNAQSNKCHCPNSPNTAPATKNESHHWSLSHMKRYLQCAEQQVSLSKLTKYCACHEKWISWLILVTHETLSTMRGATSVIVQTRQILPAPATKNESHDWSLSHMQRYLQCAEQQVSLSKLTKYCACHEKWISWLILVTHETLFTMRGVTSDIVQTHQILRLPRKMNLMIDPCHTCNAIYNARSNKCPCPNSPNTAPATKNESHDWSLSHMKRYLQCAEQQVSLSKLTKYCACHAKWLSWSILVTHETLFTMRGATSGILQHHQILRLPRQMILQNFRNISPKQMKRQLQCATDPRPFREWSENETVTPQPASQPRLLFTPTTSILYWKIQHFALIPNFTECCACHEKWHFNFTKYCACHAKWLSWSILVTHETLFTMRGATSGILQHHQILRLPRQMILQNFRNISPKQMKRQLQCATDPRPFREWSENETVTPQPASQPRLLFTPTTGILYWKIQHFALRLSFQISPNTAPATKSDTSTSPNTAPARKSDTWTSPNIAPATQSYCHDWSSSHMKCHLQCAEQPVSSSNITEYCACHAKWLS